MSSRSPFRYFKTSPEIIRLAVMTCLRFPLLLRNVVDLLNERGVHVSYETVRLWLNRIGPMFEAERRGERADRMRTFSTCRWRVDEVFVKINGERRHLWRAVHHEGEVLEVVVTKRRGMRAAVKVLGKLTKRYDRLAGIVTDRLLSRRAALRELGAAGRQASGRRLNNCTKNSHQPHRRRERAMLRFRPMRSLQTFAAIHSSVHNHFNRGRHLHRRSDFKLSRAAALDEWRRLGAA